MLFHWIWPATRTGMEDKLKADGQGEIQIAPGPLTTYYLRGVITN